MARKKPATVADARLIRKANAEGLIAAKWGDLWYFADPAQATPDSIPVLGTAKGNIKAWNWLQEWGEMPDMTKQKTV